MHNEQNKHEDQAAENAGATVKSCGQSIEVTGLGVIASLVISFGTLVGDGTILLSQYLVFLALMGISAGGMVWRLCKLSSNGNLQHKDDERLQPGIYRVSFDGR